MRFRTIAICLLLTATTMAISPPVVQADVQCTDPATVDPGDIGGDRPYLEACVASPPLAECQYIVGVTFRDVAGLNGGGGAWLCDGNVCFENAAGQLACTQEIDPCDEINCDIDPCDDVNCEPGICEPGTPCITFDVSDTFLPVSDIENGDAVATVGGVTITFTTGHFATTIVAAEGDNAPCTAVENLPGVANCEANPILSSTTMFAVKDGEKPSACLRDAWLSIDVNGDGIDEAGGPTYFAGYGSAGCPP